MKTGSIESWLVVGRDPKDINAVQSLLNPLGVMLQSQLLGVNEGLKEHSPFAVLVFVGSEWPVQIADGSRTYLSVWLITGDFPREGISSLSCDFGMSFEEFSREPVWYGQQIRRILAFKGYGSLNREWRDTVVEKLKSKTQLLEQLNARLQKLSITDGLTGLYNYRFFMQLLSDEIERASRYTFNLSILLLDIDHFKQVNDRFGHLVGDRVLQLVANELRQCVRRVDTVCRYGGEEFAILLPMTGLEPAKDLAERIRKRVGGLFPRDDFHLEELFISIGVATYPLHAKTTEELVHRADKALYRAKAAGRNQVVSPENSAQT